MLPSHRPIHGRRLGVAIGGALLVAVGWPLAVLTRFHLDYTLDDPYIHLALAERIALGHYGLNPGEPGAPSSSLLWPLLLVPGAGTVWHRFLPLLINLACTLGTAALLGSLVEQWLRPAARTATWYKAGTLLLLILAGNLIGLAYSGMEHSLQIFLVVACVCGLQSAWHGQRLPFWCLLAAALGPCVRYEMLSVLLATGLVLWLQGRRAGAALLVLAGVLPLLAFATFLHAQGLPPLPGSVLVKAGQAGLQHGWGDFLWQRLHSGWREARSWPLLMLTAGLLWQAFHHHGPQRGILLAAVGVALAHFFCGRYGWFYRYEIYAMLFAGLVLLTSLQPLDGRRWRYASYGMTVAAAVYLPGSLLAPQSARNIYEQQYQMHRFVDGWWRHDVAVNDIGWVAYGAGTHDIRVLDLMGLALPEATQHRNKDAAWLQAMTSRRHIGLVMIYRSWFPEIPPAWIEVAELRLGSRQIAVGGDTVSFYATSADAAALLRGQLRDFAATLPPGPQLNLR